MIILKYPNISSFFIRKKKTRRANTHYQMHMLLLYFNISTIGLIRQRPQRHQVVNFTTPVVPIASVRKVDRFSADLSWKGLRNSVYLHVLIIIYDTLTCYLMHVTCRHVDDMVLQKLSHLKHRGYIICYNHTMTNLYLQWKGASLHRMENVQDISDSIHMEWIYKPP